MRKGRGTKLVTAFHFVREYNSDMIPVCFTGRFMIEGFYRKAGRKEDEL